jgi:DNA-binding response OmpR family regulator
MTKVLIIDDAEDLSNLLKVNLEVEGFDCLIAPDGESGLTQALEEKPQIILLDIDMPGMNGYEVLEKLKENPDTSGIPVIMCTTKKRAEDIEKAYATGADDYLVKPFEQYELIGKIRKLDENG